MSAKTPPKPAQEEAGQGITRAPDIDNAVQELWNRAAPGLSEQELQWFAHCGEGAGLALRNMSDALEFVGCRMGRSAAPGELEDSGNVSSLLLLLSESLCGINALVFLMDLANSRLRFVQASK